MIITSQSNAERKFYQQWIWVCVIGVTIGGAVGILGGGGLGYFLGDKVVVVLHIPPEMRQATGDFLASFLKGLGDGALTSLFQWTLLRRYLSNAKWWILAGALGTSIVNAVFSIVTSSGGNPDEVRFVSIFCFTLVLMPPLNGLFSGFLEWLVLRRNFQKATRWIGVRVVADMIVAVISLIEFSIRTSLGFNIWALLVLLTFGIIEGVIFGAITGRVLEGFIITRSETV